MTQSEEIMQVVAKSIDLANQIGYEQGAADVQKRVMTVIQNYADIAPYPILTAIDAFQLVISALIDSGDTNGEA
jgi:hypothetical protein